MVEVDVTSKRIAARLRYFLPSEAVRRELLLSTIRRSTLTLDQELTNQEALARLASLGLLEQHGDEAVRLHQLIHDFLVALPSTDAAALASVVDVMISTVGGFYHTGDRVSFAHVDGHCRAVLVAAAEERTPNCSALARAFGSMLRLSGELDEALACLQLALELDQSLFGVGHPETALSVNDLGYVHFYRNEYEQAHEYLAAAAELFVSKGDVLNLAATFDNLGQLEAAKYQLFTAKKWHELALEIRQKHCEGTEPTAVTLTGLGNLHAQLGDEESAQHFYESGLRIRKALGTRTRSLAFSLTRVAESYIRDGALEQAYNLLLEAYDVRRELQGWSAETLRVLALLREASQLRGDDAAAARWSALLQDKNKEASALEAGSTALGNRGFLQYRLGNYKLADQLWEKALAEAWKEGTPGIGLAICLNNFGLISTKIGQCDRALQMFRDALSLRFRAPLLEAKIRRNYAEALRSSMCLSGAREELQVAANLVAEAFGAGSAEEAQLLLETARFAMTEGRNDEAQSLTDEALKMIQAFPGGDRRDLGDARDVRGRIALQRSAIDAAESELTAALEIRRRRCPLEHPLVAESLLALATLKARTGSLAEANALGQEALKIRNVRFGCEHPVTRATTWASEGPRDR
jgi:tetratricopeptide (TPR) repeat protein